jgi:hypothetical protein
MNIRTVKEHISGPVISFFFHIILLAVLGAIIVIPGKKEEPKFFDAEIINLEPVSPEKIPDPPDVPDEADPIYESPSPELTDAPDTTPDIDIPDENIEPVDLSGVVMNLSDSILKLSPGVAGGQKTVTKATVRSLRDKYGANKNTEKSVNKALDWLSKNQNEDGSWGVHPKSRYMFTGLATLAFLANGDTPVSQKYGKNIIAAIKCMMKWVAKKRNYVGDGNSYSHPIVSYALAEAYGITRMPKIKDAMDKALDSIIKGMNKDGGFNYYYDRIPRILKRDNVSGKMPKNSEPKPVSDLSFSGWNYQALIAAYAAGSDHPKLRETLQRAVDNLKELGRYNKKGGFGVRPGSKPDFGMSSVGLLCLGLLNEDRAAETKNALKWLKSYNRHGMQKCSWKFDRKIHKDYPKAFTHAIYTWYYQTQALFHACNGRGSIWRKWNKVFGAAMIKEQNPDGSWLTPAEKYGAGHLDKNAVNAEWRHVDQFKDLKDLKIYATTLCCLTLQVYNLQLTTYKLGKENKKKIINLSENDKELGLAIN